MRSYVAFTGKDKYLSILVNDSNEKIREIVAHQGRDEDLDILVHDPDWKVRAIVAECGRDKDLDILVKDKVASVRKAVAKQGRDRDLDVLVHDKIVSVRRGVAIFGRDKDLDILVHKLNRILPCDIVIFSIQKVEEQTHSRFSAISRTYEYHVVLEKCPFLNKYSSSLSFQPNFGLMNEACNLLKKYTDFNCVCYGSIKCTGNNSIF